MPSPIELTPEDLQGIEINRCYRSKIQCQSNDATYRALEYTHRIFNEKVAEVVRRILTVLKDKNNLEFAQLTKWAITHIKPAGQCSSHFGNPFSLQDSRANPTHHAYNKAPHMRELFLSCKARGDRWYNREDIFGDITGKGAAGLVSEVNQAAIEKISAWLTLLDTWRHGNFTPPNQLSSDDFVKQYALFLKKNRDIFLEDETGQFDVIKELLGLKEANLKRRLREIHATQLVPAHFDTLMILGTAYKDYSDKALGKEAWLKQRQLFKANYPEFLSQYQTVLNTYRHILDKNRKQTTGQTDRIPRAWYRDPNFLQVIEQEGPQGTFGTAFQSPLTHAETLAEWAEHRVKNPDWPEFKDINQIAPHWDARKFYIDKLEALNPAWFSKTGWFGLLKAYRPYEGKLFSEFRKPPALRFPDPKHHPEWLTLSDKGCFQYRHLNIIGPALIEMTVNLIDPDCKAFRPYKLQVKLDSRLKTLQPPQIFHHPKGRWMKSLSGERIFDWQQSETGEPLYEKASFYPWIDPDGVVSRISIHGGNLIHRDRAFYLHFRYTYLAPFNQSIRQAADDTSGEQTQYALNYKPGTRLLSFDLGQKADAVLAIMEANEHGQLKAVKFEPFHFKKTVSHPKPVYFQWIKLPGGNSFTAINHAETVRRKKLSKLRRQEAHWQHEQASKGKALPPRKKTEGLFAARNQETLKTLKTYIENCREQHCKQLAGVIVKVAKTNGCHGIVHENLENYRMSVKQRRLENQRLQVWAAQKTLDFLKTLCDGKELLCFPKSAAYTSQTCSQCGSWGARFNIPSKQRWEKLRRRAKYAQRGEIPDPLIEPGGDWFLCSNQNCTGKKDPTDPQTRYILQADANAARNLLIRAFQREPWGAQISNEQERERIKEELQTWLLDVYAVKLYAGY